MTPKRPVAFVGIATLVACVFAVHAQQAPDAHIADLIQSGKLRVGLGLGTPALALKDPKTGEARGPALDLARALAMKSVLRSYQLNTRDLVQYCKVFRTTSGT